MRLLINYNTLLTIILISLSQTIYANKSITICMAGRIVKSLPSYGESFFNGALLARQRNNLTKEINIKKYFYDNMPLEPIRIYNQMIKDNCSAIIGFEYLSDLLLVEKNQKNTRIPIFTSYASTANNEKLSENIFMFMPKYDYLSEKMLTYITKKIGKPKNALIVTQINRDEMLRYKDIYSNQLSKNNIRYDTFDFLENDQDFFQKLNLLIKKYKYDYIFLLSGTLASAKIVNLINNPDITYIGTENYGSSSNQSFYIRLDNKKIKSYFIRNLDFLKTTTSIKKFQTDFLTHYKQSPTILSIYSYDAANIISKTFLKYGRVTTENIYKINYDGVSGSRINSKKFYRSKNYVILSVNTNGYFYEE